MTGYQRTLPWTKLLKQLRKHRGRAAFRGEDDGPAWWPSSGRRG